MVISTFNLVLHNTNPFSPTNPNLPFQLVLGIQVFDLEQTGLGSFGPDQVPGRFLAKVNQGYVPVRPEDHALLVLETDQVFTFLVGQGNGFPLDSTVVLPEAQGILSVVVTWLMQDKLTGRVPGPRDPRGGHGFLFQGLQRGIHEGHGLGLVQGKPVGPAVLVQDHPVLGGFEPEGPVCLYRKRLGLTHGDFISFGKELLGLVLDHVLQELSPSACPRRSERPDLPCTE